MNLNELWSGNDYAWYEYRGKGVQYLPGAKRVKVIKTFKKRASYENERLSGYAEVMMLTDDGEPRTYSSGEHVTREVRARDILMRWDEYEQERAHREAQAEKIAREREESEAAENAKRSLLTDKLVERFGINPNLIYNITATGVHLSRRGLEEVLGIAE